MLSLDKTNIRHEGNLSIYISLPPGSTLKTADLFPLKIWNLSSIDINSLFMFHGIIDSRYFNFILKI